MSTSTIASLVVQLEANVARFSTDIKSAADQTQRAMSQIEAAADIAKKALGALGVSASIGGLVAVVKNAIDAADNLNDLSQKTGIAVERLGGLEYAAKASGTNIEGVATGIKKLSVNMSAAASGSAEGARTFQALGVQIKNTDGSLKGADETLLALADRFASFEDGPEKAAAAVAVFGKSGTDLIPLLNMGSDALQQMLADYEKYGGVTTDTARRADAFNDTLNKLQMMSGALWRTIASALLPTLQAIADIFVEAKQNGSGFASVGEGMVVMLKGVAVAGLYAWETLNSIGTSLGAVAAIVARALVGDFKGAAEINKQANADLQANWAKTAERAATIWNASTASIKSETERNIGGLKAPLLGGGKAAEDFSKAIEAARKVLLDSQIALSDYGKTAEEKTTPALKRLQELEASDEWAKYPQSVKNTIAALLKEADANQQALAVKVEDAAATKLLTELRAKHAEAVAKFADAQTGMVDSWKQSNDDMRREIEIIGQDDTARQKLTATLQYERDWRRLNDEAVRSGTEISLVTLQNLRAEYEERLRLIDAGAAKTSTVEAAKQYADAWKSTLQDVTSGLSNFFVDLATNGKSAFSRLWDSFKNYALRALADIAARQIVVSVLGAVGLTGASSAMAGVSGGSNLLGMAGMAGGIGNSASYLGTSLGIAASGGGLLGTTGAASGYLGAGMGGWVSAEGGASLMGGGLIESLGLSLGAATLAIAGIGLAAYFIADALDTSGEAVERFGTWISSVSDKLPRGNTLFQSSSAFGGFGIVDDFRFSDADMGESMKKFLAGIAEVDNAIAAAVGPDVTKQISENLAAVTETFSAGMEHGAISFGEIVRTRYTVALNTIHDGLGDLIKNFQGTDAELGTFAARVAGIWTALKKIDTETVTQLGLTDDAFLALAGASDELLTTFNALVTAFQYVSDLADPIAEAMDGMGTDWEKLIKQGDRLGTMAAYFDGSATSATNLANATRDYYAATVQMISAIEQIKKSVADLFNSNIRTFTMSGMTNEEQYGFLQSEVNTWMAELKSATDPSRINWLASSIAQNQSTAWGLLSPEQQQQAKQQFIDGANAANAVVQERLAAAEKAANDRYQTFLADVKDVLSEAVTKLVADAQTAADKQVAAADAQVAAANTQLVAAETPHVIYVNDQSQGASAAVGSY